MGILILTVKPGGYLRFSRFKQLNAVAVDRQRLMMKRA